MCFGSSAKVYLCCSKFLVGGFVVFVGLGLLGWWFFCCFFFYFWFYFQTVFLLLALGPFEVFQGCGLPRTAILLVEAVSLFHFNDQRRAHIPGCWSFPALLHHRWDVHPQHFHLYSVQVLLLLVNNFQLISFKRCYSLLIWPCRSVLPGSFPSLTDGFWIVMPYRSGHAGVPLLLTGSIFKEGSDAFKGEHGFLLSQVILGVSALLSLSSTEFQICSGAQPVFMLLLLQSKIKLVFY